MMPSFRMVIDSAIFNSHGSHRQFAGKARPLHYNNLQLFNALLYAIPQKAENKFPSA